MSYLLHYAPDNASLIIRLALEMGGIPYETRLVDRMNKEQNSASYRAVNPQGQIPALETPQGALFETGAILSWLIENHDGLGPKPDDLDRGRFLVWLFLTANTLHPALRQSFYPKKFIAKELSSDLRAGLREEIKRVLALIEAEAAKGIVIGSPHLNALDLYLCCLLRWCQIYPADDLILSDLSDYPALFAMLKRAENLPAVKAARVAEGLGAAPFTAPQHPNPPEGSAL